VRLCMFSLQPVQIGIPVPAFLPGEGKGIHQSGDHATQDHLLLIAVILVVHDLRCIDGCVEYDRLFTPVPICKPASHIPISGPGHAFGCGFCICVASGADPDLTNLRRIDGRCLGRWSREYAICQALRVAPR
jgi:hypothetical protein